MILASRTLLGLDPAEWEAIGVWFTGIITLGLLGFAYRQIKQATEARLEATRPFVEFDASFRSYAIYLQIKNTGTNAASNVRITFDSPPISSSRDQLESPTFTEGVPSLAPGREIRFFFDTFIQRHDTDLPKTITGYVSYSGPLKRQAFKEKFIIDLSIYEQSLIPLRDLHDLVEEVEKVRKELSKWTDSGGGVLVNANDREQKQAASERYSRRWRARRVLESDGRRKAIKHMVKEVVATRKRNLWWWP